MTILCTFLTCKFPTMNTAASEKFKILIFYSRLISMNSEEPKKRTHRQSRAGRGADKKKEAKKKV